VVLVTQSYSDDELLTAGGPDGFALFYRRHVDSILRYFARSTRDAELAADLTAEAFAAALAAKRRFKPGGPPARAWLFGIASRKLAARPCRASGSPCPASSRGRSPPRRL
jgi:DNA-directed RNA polymerase specialized sigma24 family protein